MPGIPAASLQGVDFDLLCRQYPAQATEIGRVGLLMNRGKESDEEFRLLCQLLYDVGYVAKSEELLRANAKEGDGNHDLYVQLHGTHAEQKFNEAVDRFERQFGVTLTRQRSPRYLNVAYSSKPSQISTDVGDKLSRLLMREAEVEVAYHGCSEILADVYGMPSDESGAADAQPLSYNDGEWKVV